VTPRLPEKETSAPKKRYAVVRFRGRNDADERQHASKNRRRNAASEQAKEVQTYEVK